MRLRRKLAFSAFTSLLFLASLEAGLRLYDAWRGLRREDHFEFRAAKYVYHPYLSHALSPGYRRSQPRRRISVNSFGYRGAELTVPKPSGTFRILALGGSTTFGPMVDDDQTWPARLEQRLRARFPGRPIEVVNGGADAYSTVESLIDLELRGVELEPDVVIVLQGVNDLRASWHGGFLPDYSHVSKLHAPVLLREELRRYRPWSLRMRAALERSVLYLVITNRLAPPPLAPSRVGDVGLERAPATLPSVRMLQRNLKSLAAVARAHGAEVVLVTQPLLPGLDWSPERRRDAWSRVNPFYRPPATLDELIDGVGQANQAIRAVAASEGVSLADVASLLARDETRFLDECHFTLLGHDELAALIEPEVALLLGAGRLPP